MNKIDATLLGVALCSLLILAFRHWSAAPVSEKSSTDLRVDGLIRTLADELRRNEDAVKARNEVGLFRVKEAVVEVSFVLKETRTASGGVETALVAVKADEEVSREAQHRVTVTLVTNERDDVSPPESK